LAITLSAHSEHCKQKIEWVRLTLLALNLAWFLLYIELKSRKLYTHLLARRTAAAAAGKGSGGGGWGSVLIEQMPNEIEII
jgi:hypothetical protein